MRVVILGGGTSGWMAAACIAKALGTRKTDITLLESSEISTVGVGEATIPMINIFNNLIGLNPRDIVREAKATFKLGIEFVDWARKGHSYFHPFGRYGKDMNGIGFTHYWLRQRAKGKNLDLAAYNLESVAAAEGRFGFPTPETAGHDSPNLNHAYHFDAGLYAQLLRRLSESLGVERIDAKMETVRLNPETGDVAALKLDSGIEIEGDLFIDCSGFRALLIGEALKSEYVDWKQYLPCDRAVVIPSEVHRPLPAYTRAMARDAGWQWRIPLQHRTGNGYVYASDFMSEEKAQSHFLEGLDRPSIGDPRHIKFVTGYRPEMWKKNVISLGLSAGFLEPLESTSIFLVQSALTKLMMIFPRERVNASMRNLFNEKMAEEYCYIRDFLVAHYIMTEREDTPFWKHCKTMAIPDSLAEYIELYEEEGIFSERTRDLFKETSWFAVLSGQGLYPKRYHPVADAADDESLDRQMDYIHRKVMEKLVTLPSHDQVISSLVAEV